MEVWRFQTAELRIEVGEEPALEQRVLAEIDAGDDVAGAEGNLFGLGEEVVRISIQHHFANHLDRHNFLRNELSGIEDVEGQGVGCGLIDNLKSEFPLGEVAAIDGLKKIARGRSTDPAPPATVEKRTKTS